MPYTQSTREISGSRTPEQAPNRTGLPDGLKAKMEGAFGTRLDHIRVNKNSGFPAKVGAIATTQGHRIDFAPGQYNPHSAQGQKLIGHEAWHTVQQAQGRVKPTLQMKTGHLVNDSEQLEAEADRMGERITSTARQGTFPKPYQSSFTTSTIQRARVSFWYESVYAGSQEEEMAFKPPPPPLRNPSAVAQVIADPWKIDRFLSSLKKNSSSPGAFMLKAVCGAEEQVIPASKEAIITLLESWQDKISDIKIEPISPSLFVSSESYDIDQFSRGWNPNPISSEEFALLMDMHNRGLEDARDPGVLDELYNRDTIALAIATDDLEGDPVLFEELLLINQVIQTSGTNKELKENTHERAGRIRSTQVSLPGIHLANPEGLQEKVEAFLDEYNQALNTASGKLPSEAMQTAMGFHQQFIQLHPFTNGNGRVARVLLYNYLFAAGVTPRPINSQTDQFKGMIGMNLKQTVSDEKLLSFMMAKQMAP